MNSSPITIRLNGEDRTVPAGTVLRGLLQLLGIPEEGAAVERNGEVVPRKTHGEVVLAQGDVLEVVTFVGGG